MSKSWVLILEQWAETNRAYEQVANTVIGGYNTREEAVEAGEIATNPYFGWPAEAKDLYFRLPIVGGFSCALTPESALKFKEKYPDLKLTPCNWHKYSVIPGAASG